MGESEEKTVENELNMALCYFRRYRKSSRGEEKECSRFSLPSLVSLFKVAIIVFALSTKLSGPLRDALDVKKQKRRKLSLLVFKSLLFLVRNVKTISKYISSLSLQSNYEKKLGLGIIYLCGRLRSYFVETIRALRKKKNASLSYILLERGRGGI